MAQKRLRTPAIVGKKF